MKFDIDIKEEEEVNLKTDKVIGSEEERCIYINEEEEEEDMDIEEEVSCKDTMLRFMK
jgi:hypothetical protein